MKHIGIFQIYNKKIYIDIEENKLVGYYYFNEQKEYLSINEILGLVEELFNITNLQFLKEEKGYKVFKDKDTDFLRFFKDDKEDYLKFFLENGHLALLYSKTENKSADSYHSKFFRNKKTRNTFILSISFIAVMAALLKNINTIIPIIQQEIEIKKYSSEQIIEDAIYSSNKLSLDDKQLLQNDELFEKISQVKIDYDRVVSLEEKLDNIYIEEYTEEEKAAEQKKIDEDKAYTEGYYDPLVPNRLKIMDLKDEDTKAHEFIHLLHESNCYHYISEAVTEIIKKEYYQDKLENCQSSYKEEQKRVKVLMEIIGPEVIWDMLYTGNYDEFEDTIKSLLSKEEAEIFLTSLYDTTPSKTEEEQAKINSTIDNLLGVMYQNKYNDSIKNNEVISLIYDEEEIVIENNRRYFNDAENKENRNDFRIKTYPSLDSIIEKEDNYEVLVELNYPREIISEEEYHEGNYNNIHNDGLNQKVKSKYFKYDRLKDDSPWRNKVDQIFENVETKEEASFEELVERGETTTVYYKKVSKEISIKEAEEILNNSRTDKTDKVLPGWDMEVGEDTSITANIKNNQSTEDSTPIAWYVLEEGKYKLCLFEEQELYCPPVASEKNITNFLNTML